VKFDLGFLHPLLGPAKELGQHMKEGIEAAFNVANAKGGCTAASFGWSRLTTAGRAGCSCTLHGQFYHRRFSSNLSRCEYGPSSKSCDALAMVPGLAFINSIKSFIFLAPIEGCNYQTGSIGAHPSVRHLQVGG